MYGGFGCHAEPLDLADWENYVRTIATRYRGKLTLYEVWNEPKFSDVQQTRNMAFFTGSTEAMLKLAEVAHKVLKEVDPSNQLASPGFTVNVSQLEHYLMAGGSKFADAVAFHFYVDAPESMPQKIQAVRDAMARAGLGDRPLWNTEQYFELLPPGVKAPGPGGHGAETPEAIGAYTQRAHILAAANGVKRMYWYGYELSMLDPDGSPGLVAARYNTVAHWLVGSRVGPCTAPEAGVTACALQRGTDKAFAVWRARGNSEFRVPKDWASTSLENSVGVTSDLDNSEPVIGAAPILLKPSRAPWRMPAKQ